MLKALEMYRTAFGLPDAERISAAKEIWKILVEETYSIGTVGLSPAVMGVRIVKNNLGNVPAAADERDALPDPMLVAPDDAVLQELRRSRGR